ncbi:ribonuclease J [Carnimonas bestiolae]|uniref:ribonuclease J n=1 Tax=Carnimonas bestiolae TaxID=3402172 RepID=UPI003EDC36B6
MSDHQVSIRPRKRPPLDILLMGGCGEIGMNLTLYGHNGRWIAVDCGMMIHQDLPDSPLQVPDGQALKDRNITPEALIITHGHEDHLGAVVWLWPRWGCPIWASPLAAGLLTHRFAQHGLDTSAIRVFEPGEAFEQGEFDIRPLPVTHSIPESAALLISAGRHRILHTGDWKLDPAPLLGPPINEAQFRALGAIDLVVGDSTNAMQPGHSASEAEVLSALQEAIAPLTGRVVISSFASNLARIHSAGLIARATGRRLVLAGRAMQRMVHIAKSCGYLEELPTIVPLKDAGYLPANEVLLMATGSQGEPGAALARLAHNRMRDLELEEGDTVIFSSRVIPGNEQPIAALVNALKQRNITVMDEHNHPDLHASGHPAQDELRTFYHWIKPRHLLPVHGTEAHQCAHLALAQQLGIDGEHTPSDGDWLRWTGDTLEQADRLTLSPRLINQQRDVRRDTRHGLRVVISVLGDQSGWSRVGRTIVDPPPGVAIDEEALSDWLDDQLPALGAVSLRELRTLLSDQLTHWLANRRQRAGRLYLDVVDVSA